MSFGAFAEEVPVKILKVFSNKREFVVQKTDDLSNGSELLIRMKQMKKMTHPKKATVKACKAKSCLAELEIGLFELDPTKIQSYSVTTDVFRLNSSLYIGYGSPLGAAIRVGGRKSYGDKLSLGLLVGRVQSKSGSAKLTGNTISGLGIYEVYKTGPWTFNANGELGYAFTLLEFENELDELSVKENVYVAALSGEALYRFGKWQAGINIGASQNGFKSSYTTDNGEFSNPFGRLLVFMELGLHYDF